MTKILIDKETVELAIRALGNIPMANSDCDKQTQNEDDAVQEVITALSKALAVAEQHKQSTEQKPVAWWCDIQMDESSCQEVKAPRCMTCGKWTSEPCTSPPQPQEAAPRKPLTDEQIREASLQAGMQEHYMGFHSGFIRFARAIEAAHGIGEKV